MDENIDEVKQDDRAAPRLKDQERPDGELSDNDLEGVAGGLNPQPLPPNHD